MTFALTPRGTSLVPAVTNATSPHALTAFLRSVRRSASATVASIHAALEASGKARARRELMDFAGRCESLQPELAHELRAACAHMD
jgi:hypothetical protein